MTKSKGKVWVLNILSKDTIFAHGNFLSKKQSNWLQKSTRNKTNKEFN